MTPNSAAICATVYLRLPSASTSSYISPRDLGLAGRELWLLAAGAAAAGGGEPVAGVLDDYDADTEGMDGQAVPG